MSIENDIIKNIEEAIKIAEEGVTSRSRTPPSAPVPSPPPGRVHNHAQKTPNGANRRADNPQRPDRNQQNRPGPHSSNNPNVETDGAYHNHANLGADTTILPPISQNRSPSNVHVDSTHETKVRRSKPRRTSSNNESADNNDDNQELDVGPSNFKLKFDFDSAYRDVPVEKPFRLRRERRTGLVGGLFFALFVLCISLILASVAWTAATDILGFAAPDEEVTVQIPQDFTLDAVADMLYETGLIRHRALFVWYADFSNAMDKINPGTFILNKNYDYRALVQGMTARAGTRVETTVTIPEGFTLAQIFTELERAEVATTDELWEIATYHDFDFHFLDSSTLGDELRLEGFLFPETYNFYMNSNPMVVIRRMLREFNRRFTEEYVYRAEDMGLTVHEVVIIASMIEREAGNDEERPRIAAVIYNRLASPNFPNLQIDATIDYIVAMRGIPWSTHIDSPFNTYRYPGLPPGAIANPGIASIRAALFPDNTNEYFYALNRYGSHNFFTNYADHSSFVQSDAFGGGLR